MTVTFVSWYVACVAFKPSFAQRGQAQLRRGGEGEITVVTAARALIARPFCDAASRYRAPYLRRREPPFA
jgi:hypothetical protein